MRLLAVFRKSLREQRRDLWVLTLTLLTAPVFILLYWTWFGGGSTSYRVLVLNRDRPVAAAPGASAAAPYAGGEELTDALRAVTYASGMPILSVRPVADRAAAETELANRDAALLVVIPEGFSRAILGAREADGRNDAAVGTAGDEPAVVFIGDLTNPGYTVAAAIAGGVLDGYLQAATGRPRPVVLVEQPLGSSGVRTEFETYVPGLLIVAVVMLIFAVAMTVAREVEAGTLRRLRLTPMTAFDLLAGLSLGQVLTGVASILLAFLTAWALGFRSQGPLWVAVLVGAVTTLSVVGVGLVVAAFSRGTTEAFVIGNFPLIFFLFFSGAVFPMPRIPLFALAGRTVGLYDLLPPTHAVVALNKVLTLGAGLGEVAYELVALTLLSLVYFAAGVWLFHGRHLRAG